MEIVIQPEKKGINKKNPSYSTVITLLTLQIETL